MTNKIIESENLTWIDIESPKEEEIKHISETYAIHQLVSEELLRPTLHPKVDDFFDILYLVLRFPTFDKKKETSVSREIDFIIGKKFLITVHYSPVKPLKEFIKKIEEDEGFKTKHSLNQSGFLVFHIMRHLYDFSLRELDHVQKKIDAIENKIFEGMEKEMVKSISFVGRDILNLRRILKPHDTVLDSLQKTGKAFFGEEFVPYFNNLSGKYFRIWSILEDNSQTIEALRKTNESLLSTKINEIMKFLTIMAFITFPLTLIANIFAMNTKMLPLIGRENDFWIIIGMMLALTFLFFIFFKSKKWI